MFKINYKIKFLLACLILTTFMGLELILKLFSINLVKGTFITNVYHSSLALVLSIIAILFIQKNKLFKNKVKSYGTSKYLSILIFGYLIILILNVQLNPNLSAILTFNIGIIIQSAIIAFITALFEETLMRGLFFESLLEFFNKRKYFYSAICSSLIFGLAHLWNLRVESPTAVLQQVLFASIIGIMLAHFRIKFNGLLIPIIIHFFIDFQKSIVAKQSLTSANWVQILITYLPMLIVAIIAISYLENDIKKI